MRADAVRLEALLHDDFVEIGKSGRRWTKAALIAELVAEARGHGTAGQDSGRDEPVVDEPIVEMTSFRVADLVADLGAYVGGGVGADIGRSVVVLVEWTSPGVRRSSLWVLSEAGWRLRFHQGTPSSEV